MMCCKILVAVSFVFILKLEKKSSCQLTINDELANMFATIPDQVEEVLQSKDDRVGHKLLEKLAYMLYGLRMIRPLLKTRYALDYKETLPLAQSILTNAKLTIDNLNVTYEIVKTSFGCWPEEKCDYFAEVIANLKLFLSDIDTIIRDRTEGRFTFLPEPFKVFVDRMNQKEYLNIMTK